MERMIKKAGVKTVEDLYKKVYDEIGKNSQRAEKKKKNINIQEIEKIKVLLLDQMVNISEEMLDLTTNKEKIELMKKWPNSLKLEKLI